MERGTIEKKQSGKRNGREVKEWKEERSRSKTTGKKNGKKKSGKRNGGKRKKKRVERGTGRKKRRNVKNKRRTLFDGERYQLRLNRGKLQSSNC